MAGKCVSQHHAVSNGISRERANTIILENLRQFIRCQRTGIIRRDCNSAAYLTFQQLWVESVVLVSHNTYQENELTGETGAKCIRSLTDTVRVMSAVEDYQRLTAHDLKPAMPGYVGKTVAERIVRDDKPLFTEYFHRSYQVAHVVELILSGK